MWHLEGSGGKGRGVGSPWKHPGGCACGVSGAWPPTHTRWRPGGLRPLPVVSRGGSGAGAHGRGTGTWPSPGLPQERRGVAASQLQSLRLMFFPSSCWQGCGSQTALEEAFYSNPYRGFSLPTAAARKSGFPQARLPR